MNPFFVKVKAQNSGTFWLAGMVGKFTNILNSPLLSVNIVGESEN